MKLTCKAIIFDFDGVLIDSNATYEKHWRIWADDRGVDFEHIRSVHHGIPPAQTISIVAPHLDATREAQQFVESASDDLEGVSPIQGSHRLIESLSPERWAIATSSLRRIVLPRLSILELASPAVLVTSEDITHGKPAPDPYLKAAEELGYLPAECVVIEDAPAGIRSARAAGARVIAVATTHELDELQAADVVVEALSQIDLMEAEDNIFIDIS